MSIKKKHPYLKKAGVKNEAEFYAKYPSPEHYFAEHPEDLPHGGDGMQVGKRGTITQTYPAQDGEGGQMFQDPTQPYKDLPHDLALKLMEMNMLKVPPVPQATTDTMNPMDGKNNQVQPIKKMAPGGPVAPTPAMPAIPGIGSLPVTDAGRASYNAYQHAVNTVPGQGVINWDHNQDVQKQIAKQTGFDYNQLPAYQADLQQRNSQYPGTVKSGNQFSPADGWNGTVTKQEGYRTFQSVHIGADGKVISDNKYGTDVNAWMAQNDKIKNGLDVATPQPKQWESNNQGIPMDAPAQTTPAQAPAPIARATENKDSFYSGAQDDNAYSIDKARTEEELGKGGWIKKAVNPKHKGYCTPMTKSTCTPKRKAFAETMKKHHGFHKGTGDLITPDAPPGMQPMDNSIQPTPTMQNAWTPSDDSNGQSAAAAQAAKPQTNGQIDNVNSFQQTPGPQDKAPAAPASASFGVTLNTMPLISGLDAFANMKNNAHMAANEANLRRAQAQSVMSPNNFNGGEMPTYDGGGNIVENYKVPAWAAKQKIEGGEYVQTPDGRAGVAQGDKHYMASGGIDTNLPTGTRVYSDQTKPDLDFLKELSSGKINKRMTYADAATKFDVDKMKIQRANPNNDPITNRSLDMMMSFRQDKLDQLFAHQEMMKNPMAAVAQDMAAKGMLVRKKYMGGGGTDDVLPGNPGYSGVINDVTGDIPPGQSPMPNNIVPGMNMWPEHMQNLAADKADMDAYASQVPYAPTSNTVASTSEAPGRTGPTKAGKFIRNVIDNATTGNAAVPGFLPNAVALINAMSKTPIALNRMNPEYLGHQEGLNIDPTLNNNLAIGKAAMSGNSGNASVDQARALAALGATQNADTEAYANKFNTDAKQEFIRRATNAQTKMQADAYNLQALDRFGDKMNQRTANEQAAYQAVANNAYTNSRKKLYEKNSKDLVGEFFPNYDWSQGKGFTFSPDGQPIVHAYTGGPNDGTSDENSVNYYEEKTNPDGTTTKKKITRPKKKNDV